MQVTTVNLEDLVPLEQNPRLHPERQLVEMERSLEMFGQFRPIVVDKDNVILAGNGIYTAMLRLGWTTATVLPLTDLSEADRAKLILADNKLADLGGTDYAVVDEILASLDGDFDIPGFDADVLEDLMATPEIDLQNAASYGTVPPETLESMQEASARIAAGNAGATIGTPPPPPPPVITGPIPAKPAPTTPEEAPQGSVVEDVKGQSVCPTCYRPW